MKPYYQDEWVTIYNADCRDILPELPKVDLVLTDPPYGINKADWDVKFILPDIIPRGPAVRRLPCFQLPGNSGLYFATLL